MGTDNIVLTLVIVVSVTFVSMVLHELMHGLTAYWLGDDTAKERGRLTLNPIKHIDPLLTILLPAIMVVTGGPVFGGAKPVPFNPHKVKGGEWGSALVAIAGPLTNLVLAFVCYVIMIVVSPVMTDILMQILYYGVMVNLGFFAFNILPIPPLDGSRALYAVAPEGFQRFMDSIERMGLLVVFVVVLIASPVINVLLGHMINGVLAGFYAIVSVFIH